MTTTRMEAKMAQLDASSKEILKLHKDVTNLTTFVTLFLQQMKETQHSLSMLMQSLTNIHRAESSNGQIIPEEALASDKTNTPTNDFTNTEKTVDKDRFPRELELPVFNGEEAGS